MKKKIIFEGIETNYSITDDGKVFNDKTGRELKGTWARNEYHSVQLTINKKVKTLMVHRLVAEAFCDNPNNYTIVDHIDRDKTNNNATNLRWVTTKQNSLNCDKKKQIKTEYYDGAFDNHWKELFDKYYISDKGIIVNKKTKRIIKGSERNGYRRFTYNKIYYSIHRLVWETFRGPIPEGIVINHIDGNKSNNALTNLELVTQSKNIQASYSFNRRGKKGLTSFSIDGKEIKHYDTIQAAADDLNVRREGIAAAANYGTKSNNMYWLKDESISTKEEFVSQMPDNVKSLNNLNKTKISEDGLVYSATSKHLIPQFQDNNGIYCYVSTDKGNYQKYYLPC